jgi:succinyl-CoA synthetase alpha subunit
MIYPLYFAADAIMEATDAGVALIIAITEGIPVLDMMRAKTIWLIRLRALSDPIARGSSHRENARSALCPRRFHQTWGIRLKISLSRI